MAQRSRVPQFGKWNTDEDIAYTVYFDKAREQRGGGGMIMRNPNDPQENPDLHPNGAPQSKFAPPPAHKPRVATEESRGPGPARMAQERRTRADDSDQRRSNNPSARNENAASRTNDSRHQQFQSHGTAYGEPHKRHAAPSNGYDHSAERSPLHHQAKASGGAAYASSPGAYGRSRMRADDSLSSGAAVPRFGEWNVNDPASGDGYTDVFNKIKEERQRGPGAAMSPGPGVRASPYTGNRKPTPKDNSKVCCFPWI